jgi:tetratricopeptide (TPR) repeat protein
MSTPLAARLASLDRDQLVAILERLVAQQPELADLVHLPLPGEKGPPDGAAIRAQVARIVLTMGDDWMASTRAEGELWPVIEVGNSYRAEGRIEDARTVYRAMIDGILPHYEQLRDEESEIGHMVERCVKGIGACLDASPDPGLRERYLRDAFDVYRWDALDHGGYGLDRAAEEVLCSKAVGDERGRVAGWIRAALPRTVQDHGAWRRQHGGAVILRLIGDELDDDARAGLFAESDMSREHIDLLLAAGRKDEAIDVLRHADGGDLENLADRLLAAGLEAEVTDVVDQHPALLESRAWSLRRWRVARGGIDGERLKKLVDALDTFRGRPDLKHWLRLVEEARATGRWAAVLPLALAAVDRDKTSIQPVRVRVLAAAGRFEESATILRTLPESAWKGAALELAAAAEQERPDLAISLYEQLATALRARGTKPARDELARVLPRLASLRAQTAPG